MFLKGINAFLQYPFDIGDPVYYLKSVDRIFSITYLNRLAQNSQKHSWADEASHFKLLKSCGLQVCTDG